MEAHASGCAESASRAARAGRTTAARSSSSKRPPRPRPARRRRSGAAARPRVELLGGVLVALALEQHALDEQRLGRLCWNTGRGRPAVEVLRVQDLVRAHLVVACRVPPSSPCGTPGSPRRSTGAEERQPVVELDDRVFGAARRGLERRNVLACSLCANSGPKRPSSSLGAPGRSGLRRLLHLRLRLCGGLAGRSTTPATRQPRRRPRGTRARTRAAGGTGPSESGNEGAAQISFIYRNDYVSRTARAGEEGRDRGARRRGRRRRATARCGSTSVGATSGQEGIMPGAVHVPRGNLECRIERRARASQTVIIYCAAGARSDIRGEDAVELGYDNVRFARRRVQGLEARRPRDHMPRTLSPSGGPAIPATC